VSRFKQYKTLIFDCDGVLLNSNKIKSQAFYKAALPYGEKFAQTLMDYHVRNGGVSRYHKFEYFLNHIVPDKLTGPCLKNLLDTFANEVHEGLLNCEIAEDILELRNVSRNEKWFVVSGGDESELREIFKNRGLYELFDGGIFGSPKTKHEIISHVLETGNILKPSLMFGDSQLDHEVASCFGFDFMFIYDWTEFHEWRTYVIKNEIQFFANVKEALNMYLTAKPK
jgi:phosphoglycolate phosphatase-like HAD superfamily hydrolase